MRYSITVALLAIIIVGCSKHEDSKDTSTASKVIDSVSTSVQVQQGMKIYAEQCALCHGSDLHGTEGGVELMGDRFMSKWSSQDRDSLFVLTKTTMPKTNPNSLSDDACKAVIAYILKKNESSTGTPFQPTASTIIPPTIDTEWLHHRRDPGSNNYSPLDQINSRNVNQLKVAWRWKTENFGPTPEFYFKATPLMAKGVLFTTAGQSRAVAAIDARTGETLWTYRYDEKERKASIPRQNSGRGVAYWSSPNRDKDRIVYITPGFHLIELDADTGRPVETFGEKGIVDLRKKMGVPDVLTATVGSTSPPIIVNDVIVVGSSFPVGLVPKSMKQVRGDVMGFDVKSGKHLWTFHTIPQKGEEGNDTWENESWKYTGNVAAWAPLSADPALGHVYLPLEAPTGDFYGGHRPGNNLFSQSIVCLDVKTGKKVWHYQTIHHDIWDYDLPAPPIVADVNVEGKPVKAVVQLTKQAFAFVFDRTTGKPVWPIEERSVPKSEVKGEWTSPTQPFPTKPAAYDRQGYSQDILVDFTPSIRKEALKIANGYKKGPLFTPISVYDSINNPGTLMLPDAVGGSNWQGGAFDPETGVLYVSSSTVLRPMSLEHDAGVSDMDYVAYMGASRIGPYGLPLVKPPYGRITAIDLKTGDHKWMIANAETPKWLKDIPALKGIDIPATGNADRVGILVTKTLLFAGTGSGMYASDFPGTNKFRAYNKATGKLIAELELPANQCGIPMTYSINGKQYIVIAVGAPGFPGELVALSLQ
jgi:quinoprotein glucose dehydrogenase